MKRISLAILITVITTPCFAQNYNLDFEYWDDIVPPVTLFYDSQCHAIPNSMATKLSYGWTTHEQGFRGTTDAYSGNYAGVVHLWYNGATGWAGIGECGNQPWAADYPDCKIHLPSKLYGLSGYYKYYADSVAPMDIEGKTVMAQIKTYRKNSVTGILELSSHDSLLFSPQSVYTQFYLAVSDTSSIADSLSIWFESSVNSTGSCYCMYSHILYLDALQFHFTPGTLSIGGASIRKEEIDVYPNPAKDNLTLEYRNDIKIHSISLLDVSGRLVKSFAMHSKLLDIRNLSQGVYFLRIETDRGNIDKRVLVE